MASRRGLVGGGGNSLPALSDNGTLVISTESIQVPDSSSVNGIRNATNTGWAFSGGNIWGLSSGTRRLGFLGTTDFEMANTMQLGWSSNADPGLAGSDTFLRRRGAANFQFGGADVNGTPVDQTFSVQNAITGSDLPGGHFTIDAPLGTGLGAASKISINRAIMKATGTTAQTAQNAFAVGMSKTLSNTSATAQAIATITLGSNAGGGCAGTFTIVATDGTNFDAETQSFNVSFVNKATVVTVGSVVVTGSTAASNSGSATLGITAVANGNNIDIKVTPVFTTIVPTTVTLYPVISHSTNTVTFV